MMYLHRNVISLIQLFTFLFLLFTTVACAKQPETLHLQVIEREIQSGETNETMHFMVISDAQQFDEVYDEIHAVDFQKPPRPEIDFDRQRVLIAFMGQKSTAGYEINFAPTVLHQADTLTIAVETQSLAPGAIAAQVITSPYVMAVVEKGAYTQVKFVDADGRLLDVIDVR
jgi:PrcB C-terminal